jgi:hypothetical protein
MSTTEAEDLVIRNCLFAADHAALAADFRTPAERTLAIVTAAFEFGFGNGIIAAVPQEYWPSNWLACDPPYNRERTPEQLRTGLI